LKSKHAAGWVARSIAVLALAVSSASAQDPSRHHGSTDLTGYIAVMESPSRAEWQKPEEVLAALGLQRGQIACDIGAGPGYFTLRLANVVGPSGRVYAVDVEPGMLAALLERLEKTTARNVTPVLSLPDDPLLPDGLCDLVLIVDTYHHFPDGEAYLRRLARTLAPRGRIANVDFQKRPTPVGPPLDHRVSREDFVATAARAGLDVVAELAFLPHQYFVVLKPKEPAERRP